MANKEDTPPASKADVALVKSDLRALAATVEQLQQEVRRQAEQTRRHFDVVAEQLVRDFQDAFSDRTSQHSDKIKSLEGRVDRVERHLGLAA